MSFWPERDLSVGDALRVSLNPTALGCYRTEAALRRTWPSSAAVGSAVAWLRFTG